MIHESTTVLYHIGTCLYRGSILNYAFLGYFFQKSISHGRTPDTSGAFSIFNVHLAHIASAPHLRLAFRHRFRNYILFSDTRKPIGLFSDESSRFYIQVLISERSRGNYIESTLRQRRSRQSRIEIGRFAILFSSMCDLRIYTVSVLSLQ